MDENQISQVILDAAIEVHRTLGGPGLLESVYRDALSIEVQSRGVQVEREVYIPVVYKGHVISDPLRLDLLAEKRSLLNARLLHYTIQFSSLNY